MSFNKRLEGLADGKYDVIAYGILATSELKDSLLLTTPIVLNKQVLVQRKLENVPDSSLFIKSQLDLAGKTLHVVKGSPSILRIRNLGNEIGDTIYVYDGVTAYFHQVVRRLQMELLDAGCIGGCVVLGEVTDIGTQLNGQHLLGEFGQYVEVMVERELGQWKYCFIARLLPGHFVVQVEDTEAEVLFQRGRQHFMLPPFCSGRALWLK